MVSLLAVCICRSTTRASLSERTLRGCNSDRRRRGRTRTVACCSEAGDAPAIAALERTTTRYVGRWPVLPIFGVASCRGLAVRRARTNLGDAPEQPSSRAGSESRALAGVHVPAGERGVRHKPSRVEVSRKRYHFSALFRLTNQDNQWRTRGGFGSRAKPGRTITSLRPQPFLMASRPGAGRYLCQWTRKGEFSRLQVLGPPQFATSTSFSSNRGDAPQSSRSARRQTKPQPPPSSLIASISSLVPFFNGR